MIKKEVKAIDTLSRKLTKGLRHGSYGFDKMMAADGYVKLKAILAMEEFKMNTLKQVEIGVRDSDKQRLEIDATGTKIRATTGQVKLTRMRSHTRRPTNTTLIGVTT